MKRGKEIPHERSHVYKKTSSRKGTRKSHRTGRMCYRTGTHNKDLKELNHKEENFARPYSLVQEYKKQFHMKTAHQQ